MGQRILGLKHARKFESYKVELYTIDQFLADKECDQLVAIIEKHLVPSALAGKDTNPHNTQGQKIRTSRTTHLSSVTDAAEKAYMHSIAQKISRKIGISLDYAEDIQGQCYLPGQEFKEHLGAFEPGTTIWEESGGLAQGNRTWTFMIYLTDVEEGGTTYFSKLGHHFFPKKGQAVVWNNL
ncbi:MAG: 2OG-Fe(II) oxygenase [Roseivirga sp.]